MVERNNQNLWQHTRVANFVEGGRTTKVRAREKTRGRERIRHVLAQIPWWANQCVLRDARHENKVLIIQFTIFSSLYAIYVCDRKAGDICYSCEKLQLISLQIYKFYLLQFQ